MKKPTDEQVELLRKESAAKGVELIVRQDDKYPVLLREISSPPHCLFVRGHCGAVLAKHPIAVVGTRKVSSYGIKVLQKIIPPLVQAGATIVSGLAYGADSLAHEIALQEGGKCVAVLASGVDTIYPREHYFLADRILAEGGALVSEHPLGTEPLPQHFPARNRIISGLSKATIIIEAKEQSGSLITAQFALDQGREVFAVPGDIFSENQQGTNRLIAEGAYPVISVDDLLSKLNLICSIDSIPDPELVFETKEEKSIYECLQEPRSLDELCGQTKLSGSTINQTLSMMELKGMIINCGTGRFERK